jgi:hypothetical protein
VQYRNETGIIPSLDQASGELQGQISPMVQVAKSVALNIDDKAAVEDWRRQNRALLEAAEGN